jgi:hypothetical protein
MEGGVNHQGSHLDGYDLPWEDPLEEDSRVVEDPMEEDSRVVEDPLEEDSQVVEDHQYPSLCPQHQLSQEDEEINW